MTVGATTTAASAHTANCQCSCIQSIIEAPEPSLVVSRLIATVWRLQRLDCAREEDGQKNQNHRAQDDAHGSISP